MLQRTFLAPRRQRRPPFGTPAANIPIKPSLQEVLQRFGTAERVNFLRRYQAHARY